MRVDQLAMKLYESTVEGKNHSVTKKNTIKNTIHGQALQNFQIGLHEDIKTIVRMRNYHNLQEAIAVATSENQMKSPMLHQISQCTRHKTIRARKHYSVRNAASEDT